MADAPSNGLKRPHPTDGLYDGNIVQKKIRSNNGSPAPQTKVVPGSKPDVSKIMADARARAAAVAARLQGGGTKGVSSTAHSPSPGPAPSAEGNALSRIEQIKARVAATMAKSNATTTTTAYQAPAYDDGVLRARGGLSAALHPSLLDTNQDARSSKSKQAIQPKFATTMANRRPQSPADQSSKSGKAKKPLDLSGGYDAAETRNNPYFDASLGGQTATLKARNAKQLSFNQKGKYIAQGVSLRRTLALEAMRKRIAASAKKANLEEEPSEKSWAKDTPPEVEWWDEGLIDSYADIATDLKLDDKLTRLVQHPILISPPGHVPPPKPLPLTSKEQAKLRRQRRMADLKEHQMKVRLGLEPVDAPKIKKSNLMRVLGQEAVQDPTAVEARVNREIAERAQKHVDMNEERKLTKEQQHEKLATKQAGDLAKGVFCTVYKIDSLVNGRHRFKVGRNAEQENLYGICVIHPKQCLVVTQGGQHSIKAYKKLMLNRIAWQENSASNKTVREGNAKAHAEWLESVDSQGNLRSLDDNKCTLVWEGQLDKLTYHKWSSKVCETDKEAMDALSRGKMENFWTQAKSLP